MTGQLLAREATARAGDRNLGAKVSVRERGKLGKTGKVPDDGSNKATRARFARERETHRREKKLCSRKGDQAETEGRISSRWQPER
jgi:hypothetical protein